jgi:hypothetical protein
MKVLYRISDAGNQKQKLDFASKKHCFENCLKVFGKDSISVFADNCLPRTIEMINDFGLTPVESQFGNALSWKKTARFALDNFGKEESVYFVEDDYLHLENALKVLEEGLQIADYVSLYDHPDKYKDGENPFVDGGGEASKVFLTTSSHWKTTNSTTMTFATKVQTLIDDWSVWLEFTSEGFPNDFGAFQRLCGIGNWENRIFGNRRTLITCIPARSTHTEKDYVSPLVHWK